MHNFSLLMWKTWRWGTQIPPQGKTCAHLVVRQPPFVSSFGAGLREHPPFPLPLHIIFLHSCLNLLTRQRENIKAQSISPTWTP